MFLSIIDLHEGTVRQVKIKNKIIQQSIKNGKIPSGTLSLSLFKNGKRTDISNSSKLSNESILQQSSDQTEHPYTSLTYKKSFIETGIHRCYFHHQKNNRKIFRRITTALLCFLDLTNVFGKLKLVINTLKEKNISLVGRNIYDQSKQHLP